MAFDEAPRSNVEEDSVAQTGQRQSFAVARLSLSPESLTLAPGETATITASPTDARGTLLTGTPVEWSSTDPKTATVDDGGIVTAVAPGGAEIVARADEAEARAKVTVVATEEEEKTGSTPPGATRKAPRKKAAPRADQASSRALEIGGVSVAPAGAAAILAATALAELAERDEVDPVLLLAGIALAGEHTEGRQDTAFFLTHALMAKEEATAAEVATLLGLKWSHGIDPTRLPVPLASRARTGGAVAAAVAAADRIVGRVGANPEFPRHRPPVSTRHLLAALLTEPVGRPARDLLRERGHDPAQIRADFLDFLLTRPVTEDHDAWREILLPEGFVPVGRLKEAPAAAVAADVHTGADLLDVEPEVNALAAVLASGKTTPPLSVGLFGDWGTGKSFFMRKLHDRIAELEEDAAGGGDDDVCGRIAQIWFNAWHYMDANLWASLAAHIFDSLADELARKNEQPAEELRAELSRRLQTGRSALDAAAHRKQVAETERRAADSRLSAIRSGEVEERSRIQRGVAALAAVAEHARADERVRRGVDAAAEALGRPAGSFDPAEIDARLRELKDGWGRIRQIATSLARPERRWRSLGWIALLALASLLLALVLQEVLSLDELVARLTALAAAASGAAAWLRPWFARAGEAVRRLEEANAAALRIEDAERRRQNEMIERAERELDRLVAAERAAEQARAAAEREVQRLEREITEIEAGRRLGSFIEERSGSEDYRRHLGVVNLIRGDFDRLATLLGEVVESVRTRTASAQDGDGPPEEGEKAAEKPIERIILYVDDLDRCPPERVMEVLQAVHLLLAFELFIVVVGVDARWLLRSVEVHHDRALSSGDGDADDGDRERYRPTPHHYLEKIFQIPLALRPMDDRGFGRMVDELLNPRRDGEKEEARPDVRWTTERTPVGTSPVNTPPAEGGRAEEKTGEVEKVEEPGAGSAPTGTVTGSPRTGSTETRDGPDADLSMPDDVPEKTADVLPESLAIGEDEQAFLRLLGPLIPSPRAAKRFVNVYRFLRAQLGPRELARFRGDGTGGGELEPPEHRAAALLLAVLTGMPGPAEWVLDALSAPGARTRDDVRALLRDAAPNGRDEEERRSLEGFEVALDAVWTAAARAGRPLPAAAGPYARWAGEVARFSFRRSAAPPARQVS